MEPTWITVDALFVQSDDQISMLGTSYRIFAVDYDGEFITFKAVANDLDLQTNAPVIVKLHEFTQVNLHRKG